MAAVPTSVAGLEPLIVNTASPIIESAVQSLEAERSAQAERIDSVETSLSERIEEAHQERPPILGPRLAMSSLDSASWSNKCAARLQLGGN